jgi:hypothetical protein
MKGLNGVLTSALQSIEADSWKEDNDVGWTAVLTYEHGGAYYCFRLEKAERDERHPHGITETTLREIADALPKRLKPLPDGIGRRFTLAASRTESKSQRKI